jgi:NAD(P)-dependent dehydrogenase (short-subunit alcohol dehydrogenase family)
VTAQGFLREGAIVVIASRSKKHVREALHRLNGTGSRVYGEVADLAREASVKAIMEKMVRKFGKIDIVVNAAGVSKPARFDEIRLKDWYSMLDNNLTNAFLTCKHALKYMMKRKYGKIINVSSIAGRFRSKLAGVHYTCAKAAIIALTKQLAAEVGRHGINVNVLCPSQTRTEMLKPFLKGRVEQNLRNSIPLGYIASPEEQASVILFLASDEASYMTGAAIDVNGGQL